MKKRLWYFYFGASTFLAVTSVFSYLFQPTKYNPILLLYVIDFVLGVIGTFAYLWKKKLFIPQFWLLFFVLNVLLDSLFLIYSAVPHAPFISALSYLDPEGTVDSFGYTILSTLFDIPMLIAVFNLSRDRFYNPVEQKKKTATQPGWNLFQTALWGYSTVFMGLILVFSIFPQKSGGATENDALSGLASFLPMAVFWLMVVIQYKIYHWNWWRMTLVLNSLLYTGLILVGLFTASPAQDQANGFDIISIIESLILFISLIVFGRDQAKWRRTPGKNPA